MTALNCRVMLQQEGQGENPMKFVFRSIPILITAGLFLSTCGGPQGSSSDPQIVADELREHVEWLASDAMKGRKAGTREADRAARYLANEFERYGLEPMGDEGGYLQAFTFTADISLGSDNALKAEQSGTVSELALNSHWRPLAFTDDGNGEFELVFAGYGISNPGEGYDDYEGLDVSGKAVLVLPYGPLIEGGGMLYPTYHALRRKAAVARDKGAVLLLIAPHPALDPHDFLEPLRYDQSSSSSGIMAATVTVDAANILLGDGPDLSERHTGIDATVRPASEATGTTVTVSVDVEPLKRTGYNVVGGLSTAGENAPWVIFGAHYDHLGMGGEGSLEPGAGQVHNGADDNASGTAGLLELAQLFAHEPLTTRNLFFAAFTAEEIGLLGSSYLASNLPPAVGNPEAMLNMDMIGRLTDNALNIYGTGTSPSWDGMVEDLNSRDEFGFEITSMTDGFGPSDHSSFYAKEIPVLHFFTGTTEDYHTPSDDPETLNYEGHQQIVRYIHALVASLDGQSDQLVYQQAGSQLQGGRMGFSVYTGVTPDFAWDGEGFRITAASPGSPAAMAGIEGGDIILRMGQRIIRNIYDYTYALQEGTPGQRVEMEIRRGDQTFTVQIVLGNARARGR